MSNYSKIYWLTRLDYLQGLFMVISIIGGIGLLFYIIFGLINADCEDKPFRKKPLYIWVPVLFTTVLIGSLIPTKKEAILIIAGGKTMDYVEKDTSLNKLPYQTTAIISEFLDKQLKDLKEKK